MKRDVLLRVSDSTMFEVGADTTGSLASPELRLLPVELVQDSMLVGLAQLSLPPPSLPAPEREESRDRSREINSIG
jgi:hypothetical protein